LSNIIFNMQIRENQDNPREIDHNNLVEKKLSALKQQQERDLRAKLQVEKQPVLDGDGNPVYDEEGNQVFSAAESESEVYGGEENVPADFVSEEQLKQMEDEAQRKADDIINNAKNEADRILENAKDEAENVLADAMESGKKEGYQAGMTQAQDEINAKRVLMDEELKSELDKINAERSTMEKDLLNVILEVVEKVFKCQFSGKKDIMLNLIDGSLDHIEGSKDVLIRVGADNYDMILDKLNDIKKALPEDVNISVTKDPLFDENKCMIETDGGVIDCSLDVELDNLIRDIRSVVS
jgi:flagellar assembly protein FliH